MAAALSGAKESVVNLQCFFCQRTIKPGQGVVGATLFRWSDYDERAECFHAETCFPLFQVTGRPHSPVYSVKAITHWPKI